MCKYVWWQHQEVQTCTYLPVLPLTMNLNECIEHEVKMKLIQKIRDKRIIVFKMLLTSGEVQNHNFKGQDFLTTSNGHSGDALPIKNFILKSHQTKSNFVNGLLLPEVHLKCFPNKQI